MDRKPTFFWQGLLIVLPVLLLAAVGIFSLWKDRETVTLEARTAAGQYGEQLALFLSSGLNPVSEYESAVDAEGNLIGVGTNGGPGEYPRVSSARPYSQEHLDFEATELWELARSAELAGDLSGSIDAYERFLATEPPEPFYSSAEYARALLFAALANNEEALEILRSIEETAAFTETGLPLAVLVQFQQVKLLASKLGQGDDRVGNQLHQALRELGSKAIEEASYATPSLLNGAADLVAEFGEEFLEPMRLAQATWVSDELTRAFHRSMKPLLRNRPSSQNWFWTEWKGEPRLVVLVPAAPTANGAYMEDRFDVHVYAESQLRRAVENLVASAPIRVPVHLEPAIYVSGRRVLGEAFDRELLATEERDWELGGASAGGLHIALHLVDPDVLYAQQRQRTIWFAALIVVAAVAALTGYAVAWRAFHRQLHLNEMKSNFVASVSHELRAPIASVRLMAEGLERGTVQEPEKQRGYFKFIVRECSRLSSLVENVLDFSRIEQNRREYELEPTDVAALVRHTTELMRPCALERQVRLTTNIDSQLSRVAPQPELDGKAVQQALVNLIDNAIKHSPPENAVTVELNLGKDGGSILLSVEDRGEGIPAAEHHRIFDRFYRLGSELRRKTQGAGIGLSIVKHIVEGHGGTICVQSKVGEGSRFIIEVPITVEAGDHG